MRWGIILTTFVLAGCSGYTLERNAKEAVAGQMKDPNSIEFRNIVSYPDKDLVCGEVNAKNSYGAYSGYTRFYYYRGDVWLRDNAPESAPNYEDMCDAAAAGRRVPALSYNQRLVDALPEGPQKRELQKLLDEMYMSGAAFK